VKCKIEGCNGEVSGDLLVSLRTGCSGSGFALACGVCGRLHWPATGNLVFNRPGHAAFLENGRVVNKDKSGKVMSTL
jgi:hypothetical protein